MVLGPSNHVYLNRKGHFRINDNNLNLSCQPTRVIVQAIQLDSLKECLYDVMFRDCVLTITVSV